jgi:hypothetical protein
MATPCPGPCGDITWDDWIRMPEVERQFKLLCAIQSGPIEPPDPPAFGTSTPAGETSTDPIIVPAGWSSFTITNLVESPGEVNAFGVSLAPGLSIGHGAFPGFPGTTFTVTPTGGATAVVTWVIPS